MEKEISLSKLIFNLCLFLCIYYLSFTFIAASLDKISDPYSFSRNINDYQITPYWIANFVALLLPWLELICGFLLIISSFRFMSKFKLLDVSNNFIILMLLWFIFILAIASIRGLDIDCGCGLAEKTTPFDRLKEDIALLIASFIIKFRDSVRLFFKINN
tara:strand:+ start:660 stop:1139 length:480 start_codon:yes stop_codon:yes gene_type:complete